MLWRACENGSINQISRVCIVRRLALSLLLLAGCAAPVVTPDDEPRPVWIDNPGDGVSASAAVHVRGRAAQEELAIARAREELAKRQGVKVDSESNIQQQYAGGRLSTQTDKQITETVTGIEVKSQVKAKWLESGTGVLWVWVVPER